MEETRSIGNQFVLSPRFAFTTRLVERQVFFHHEFLYTITHGTRRQNVRQQFGWTFGADYGGLWGVSNYILHLKDCEFTVRTGLGPPARVHSSIITLIWH